MEYKVLQDCPVCGHSLKITGLQCFNCHTQITGNFEPPTSKVLFLGKKDLDFVELFVKLRGNIKEVEKALGVSYPTVRGILDNVIKKMGFESKAEANYPHRKRPKNYKASKDAIRRNRR